MISWIIENMGTIVMATIIVLLVLVAVIALVRSKKKGKSPCGCGCSHCAIKDSCHGDQ